MSSEDNLYRNAAFGEGREGHLQMKSGGEMQLSKEATVEASESGVSIYANDEYDTVTVVPWSNVAWLRSKLVRRKSAMREIPESAMREIPARVVVNDADRLELEP